METNNVVRLPIRGGEAIVDAELAGFLSQFKWHVNNNGYAKLTVWLKDEKRYTTIYMHQVVKGMGTRRDERILLDHINRNRLDNRRDNLRWATYQENYWNSERGDNLRARGFAPVSKNGL